MTAGCQTQSPQHIVDPSQFNLLAVDRGRPVGIVDVREYQHATLCTAHPVLLLVRLVVGQRHRLQGVKR